MTTLVRLVPGNASALEVELDRTWGPLDRIDPIEIERLWDPWRCPRQFLPWLAWALSVDLWEDSWDDIRKRQQIADSPNWHRLKGTRLAVDMALAAVGRRHRLVEWWQQTPEGRRGTGTAFISLVPGDSPAAVLQVARRLTMRAKPKSRVLAIKAGIYAEGAVPISVSTFIRPRIRVVPRPPELVRPPVEIRISVGRYMKPRIKIGPAAHG